MAAAQANLIMEDQAQVLASPSATLVGVYDGHGGPDASRFLRSALFPHVQRTSAMLCCFVLLPLIEFLSVSRRARGADFAVCTSWQASPRSRGA